MHAFLLCDRKEVSLDAALETCVVLLESRCVQRNHVCVLLTLEGVLLAEVLRVHRAHHRHAGAADGGLLLRVLGEFDSGSFGEELGVVVERTDGVSTLPGVADGVQRQMHRQFARAARVSAVCVVAIALVLGRDGRDIMCVL